MRVTSGILPEARDAFQVEVWGLLREVLMRLLVYVLEELMEEERARFVGCGPYERSGRRRCYRNGYHERLLSTVWGDVRVRVPRVRGAGEPFRPRVIEAYQRREREVEEVVVMWLARGMSTRAVSDALRRCFGVVLSPGGVSRVVARVDAAMEAFRSRRLERPLRFLYLDGKWGKVCESGGGRGRGRARKAVLLLAWGVDWAGRQMLVDFRVAPGEDFESWDQFLRGLRERGVGDEGKFAERLEVIITDGNAALDAALEFNYPGIPHQVCVFHKIKNLAEHLAERRHRGAITREASQVFAATSRLVAEGRLKRWAKRWGEIEPKAVASLMREKDRLLLYYRFPGSVRSRLRTTNPLERFTAELEKKFARVGVFPTVRSWERLTYILYRDLEARGYAPLTNNLIFTQNT